jgi:hypothetical protein
MGYEEKYCIWSGSSIRGYPLEEASEQERIPSIIGSIVWCSPTCKVVVFYIVSYILCGDYICRSIQVLNRKPGSFLETGLQTLIILEGLLILPPHPFR